MRGVWGKAPRRSQSDGAELKNVVANYRAKVSGTSGPSDLVGVTVRALAASRKDPFLARMMPVFLWRARLELDLPELCRSARKGGMGATLGYFLELAEAVSEHRGFRAAIGELRKHVGGARPAPFFERAVGNPFEALLVEQLTPELARRWGFLTGTPVDCFASYFTKVSSL